MRSNVVSSPADRSDALCTKRKLDGSAAGMANTLQLVDGLLTNAEFNLLIDRLGENAYHEFQQVSLEHYLMSLEEAPIVNRGLSALWLPRALFTTAIKRRAVLVVIAQQRFLREARFDDRIQAVVLRIDSPGGSAFASEIIRREILALKQAQENPSWSV